jgi:hypothetical protein
MPNVTVYLPNPVAEKVQSAANKEGVSMSRWIALHVADLVDNGPASELLSLEGSDPEFPDIEELRSGYGHDTFREELN